MLHFRVALATVSLAFPAAADNAVVTKRTVYPGQIVDSSALITVSTDHCDWCKPGYLTDVSMIAGKVAVTTLLSRRPIYPEMVRPEWIILQGKPADVVFRNGALEIRLRAIPLNNGGLGDVVSVRNADSKIVVRGVVQANGTIQAGGR